MAYRSNEAKTNTHTSKPSFCKCKAGTYADMGKARYRFHVHLDWA